MCVCVTLRVALISNDLHPKIYQITGVSVISLAAEKLPNLEVREMIGDFFFSLSFSNLVFSFSIHLLLKPTVTKSSWGRHLSRLTLRGGSSSSLEPSGDGLSSQLLKVSVV